MLLPVSFSSVWVSQKRFDRLLFVTFFRWIPKNLTEFCFRHNSNEQKTKSGMVLYEEKSSRYNEYVSLKRFTYVLVLLFAAIILNNALQ